MIEAKELRVGNLIEDELGKPKRVQNILGERFNIDALDGIDRGFPLTEMNGIPITPELLEKCGFEYSASFGECRYKKKELEMDENFNPLVQEGDEFLYYGKRIEHLHQLQNLYFALTGEELEINL